MFKSLTPQTRVWGATARWVRLSLILHGAVCVFLIYNAWKIWMMFRDQALKSSTKTSAITSPVPRASRLLRGLIKALSTSHPWLGDMTHGPRRSSHFFLSLDSLQCQNHAGMLKLLCYQTAAPTLKLWRRTSDRVCKLTEHWILMPLACESH